MKRVGKGGWVKRVCEKVRGKKAKIRNKNENEEVRKQSKGIFDDIFCLKFTYTYDLVVFIDNKKKKKEKKKKIQKKAFYYHYN